MENPMTAGREGADAVFLELDNMSWFLDGAKHRMPRHMSIIAGGTRSLRT